MSMDAWKKYVYKDQIMRDVFYGFINATRPNIICDVGSYNGDEAIRFKRLSPKSRVYAFEANRQNVEECIHTRADLAEITVENVAVSDVDGEVIFNALESDTPNDWRRASGSIHVRSEHDYCASFPVPVRSVRLDSYFEEDLGKSCTFILWIDVEGAVDRVFNGAKRVLSQTLLIRAEVENFQYWQNQKVAKEIISKAEQSGFALIADSYTPELNEQFDVLLINRNWIELIASSHAVAGSLNEAQNCIGEHEIGVFQSQSMAERCVLQSTLTARRAVIDAELHTVKLERDSLAAEARRWYEAVIAITAAHDPFMQAAKHNVWRKLTRRLVSRRRKISSESLAARAVNAGNWELAIRYYRDALDREPYKPNLWVQCGRALQEAGKFSEAEFAYRRVLEIDSKNIQARFSLEKMLRQRRVESFSADDEDLHRQ